jgi:hypothetical protein
MAKLRGVAIVCALILVLHAALGRMLAESDFTAALAMARHGQMGTSLGFGLLLAVRLVAIVMVPALAVAGVGLMIYEWALSRRR